MWRNKGSTELYCLFIAADSIVDAISFIRRIDLWSQNMFSPNLALDLAGFEILNPAWTAPAGFEVVKSGATLDLSQYVIDLVLSELVLCCPDIQGPFFISNRLRPVNTGSTPSRSFLDPG